MSPFEVRGQQILPPEVTDDPLLVLLVLAVRLDEPHVIVLHPLAASGPDDAQEHGFLLSRHLRETQTHVKGNVHRVCHYALAAITTLRASLRVLTARPIPQKGDTWASSARGGSRRGWPGGVG